MFIIDQELCIQCDTCTHNCHQGAISIKDGELVHDSSRCNCCGHCLASCPRDAIQIDGDGYNIEDVEEFNMLTKATAKQIRREIMMRRSVRTFNEEELTDSEISYVLEAAKYAPTAKNCQGNALLVLTDPEKKAELLAESMEELKALADEWKEKAPGLSGFFAAKYKNYKEKGFDGLFYDAPCVIYVFSGSDIDGAICAASMMQMITAQNLGGVYLQLAADPFNHNPELMKKYNIPEGRKCVIAIAFGHTDEEFFSSVPRKEIPTIYL